MSVVLIAKRAGVSIATVSRVMTNSRRVQPEIAQKVRSAIEELGLPVRQVRNRERRSESEPAARKIGIITVAREYRTWFTDPVIAALVAEVTRAASDHGADILLAEMPDPKTLCRAVEQRQIDGALMLIPSEVHIDVAETLIKNLPVVRLMGAQLGPVQTDQVGCDHMSIGYLAANYLIQKGCRELAFMALYPDWTLCQMRAHGFFSAADTQDLNCPVETRAYFPTSRFPVDHSYGGMAVTGCDWGEVMKKFVARKPTGLFVAREAELNQVYRMLNEHGITPQKDIQVISCDNSETWLNHLDAMRPATIDLGLTEIARTAVSRLIKRIEHPEEPVLRLLINPRLVLPPATAVTA